MTCVEEFSVSPALLVYKWSGVQNWSKGTRLSRGPTATLSYLGTFMHWPLAEGLHIWEPTRTPRSRSGCCHHSLGPGSKEELSLLAILTQCCSFGLFSFEGTKLRHFKHKKAISVLLPALTMLMFKVPLTSCTERAHACGSSSKACVFLQHPFQHSLQISLE